MILVDANLLIYAIVEELPQHREARAWLDGQLSATPRVGLPWASLLACVRIVSNPGFASRPVPLTAVWRQVADWIAQPPVWIPDPTERHADVLGPLLADGGSWRHVTDAHLAALAIEHGLTLCSSDRDFARFRGLDWRNPLSGG